MIVNIHCIAPAHWNYYLSFQHSEFVVSQACDAWLSCSFGQGFVRFSTCATKHCVTAPIVHCVSVVRNIAAQLATASWPSHSLSLFYFTCGCQLMYNNGAFQSVGRFIHRRHYVIIMLVRCQTINLKVVSVCPCVGLSGFPSLTLILYLICTI